MSIALSDHSRFRTVKEVAPWLGMGVCLIFFATYLLFDFFGHKRDARAVQAPANEEPASSRGQRLDIGATPLVLPDSKLKAANLMPEPARYDQLPIELGVAGRIEINADHRIVIRPRAAGVVLEVFAHLGQKVKRGDRLVTLDSPDVGTARLNLRAKQRELHSARIEADWKSQVAATVELLIPEIRQGTDPAAIEKEFADKPLGTYRGSLLAGLLRVRHRGTRGREDRLLPQRGSHGRASCLGCQAHPRRDSRPSSTPRSNRPSSTPPRRSDCPK